MATSWLSELISWLWTWKPITIYYVPGHLTSRQARPSAGIPWSSFASIWIVIMWYSYWVFFFGLLEPECWKMSAICKWYSRFHNHPGAPWWTPCIGSLAFVLQLYGSRLVFKISNPTDLLEFQGKFNTPQTNRIFLSGWYWLIVFESCEL
jgi:hypothetical protein